MLKKRRKKALEEGHTNNIWNRHDFVMCGLGEKSRTLAIVKHVRKCIKWSKQRIVRGYADSDIWNMYGYLQVLLPDMLEHLKNHRCGSPGYLGENYTNEDGILVNDTCHEVWANVSELIDGISKTQYIDMAMLEKIVATDNKQRYAFNEDKTLIRANQGHSIPVDVELPETKPPVILYHGTGEKYVKAIDEQGLIPKSRLYVHLSGDEATAKTVGSRHGKPVIYEIHASEMYNDGYVFYLSVNGVWLTKSVPTKYMKKL